VFWWALCVYVCVFVLVCESICVPVRMNVCVFVWGGGGRAAVIEKKNRLLQGFGLAQSYAWLHTVLCVAMQSYAWLHTILYAATHSPIRGYAQSYTWLHTFLCVALQSPMRGYEHSYAWLRKVLCMALHSPVRGYTQSYACLIGFLTARHTCEYSKNMITPEFKP